MYDVEKSSESQSSLFGCEDKATSDGCVGENGGYSIAQSSRSTRRELNAKDHAALASYRELRSVAKVSQQLKIGEDSISKRLRRVARHLGKDSIRGLIDDDMPSNSNVTKAALRKLIDDQHYKCALTGQLLTPDTAALDHRTSIADGGEHVIENVCWVHKDVNAAKGAMSEIAFISMCQMVASHCGGGDMGGPPSLGPFKK